MARLVNKLKCWLFGHDWPYIYSDGSGRIVSATCRCCGKRGNFATRWA